MEALRILVIDDSPEDRAIFVRFLRQAAEAHYTVLEEELGAAGLLALQAQSIDCVLVDYNLPDMSGIGFLAALQALHIPNKPPVILITGSDDEEVMMQAMHLGAQDYISRQRISAELLTRSVAYALQQHRLSRDLAASHRRLDSLLVSITDGFFALDRSWRFTYANAEAERFMQAPQSALIGQNIWACFPLVEQMGLRPILDAAMVARQTQRVEVFAPTSSTWFEISTYPSNEGISVAFREITDRKEIEATIARLNDNLQARVQELQTLLNVVPVGIAIASDPQAETIVTNEYLARLPLFPRAHALLPGTAIAPEVAYRLMQDGQPITPAGLPLYTAARRNTVVRDAEIDIIQPDGRTMSFLGYATPLLDEQGAVRGSVAAFLDITQRKQFSDALHQQQKELSTILELIPDIVTRFDRQLRHLYVSPAVENATGLKVSDYLGKTNRELGMPEHVSQFWETQIISVFETNQVAEFDFMFPTPDRTRWYEAVLLPETSASGEVTSVLGISRDITSSRQGQRVLEYLSDSSKLLGASLQFEDTFPALAAYAAETFADWCLITLVDAQENLTPLVMALGGDQADGSQTQIVPAEHLELDCNAALGPNTVLATGTPQLWTEAPSNWPQLVECVAGIQIPNIQFKSAISVPLEARGRILGVLSCATTAVSGRRYAQPDLDLIIDVGQRAATAMDNALLYREAQDAILERDAFLSLASHELKNPLTTLLGRAELWRRRNERRDDVSERDALDLQRIIDQAERIKTLLADLLDHSQLDQLHIIPTPLLLNALLERVISESQFDLKLHTLEFISPESLWVRGDTMRLEQVFSNLLGNAIKYSPAGGTITVTLERDDASAVIRFSDEGMGIPAAALELIFKRFYRVPQHSAQVHHGSGIGLYVVREIVQRHGGTVEVSSQEGAGSTFTIRLALTTPPPTSPAAPA